MSYFIIYRQNLRYAPEFTAWQIFIYLKKHVFGLKAMLKEIYLAENIN
jgi:hypothetical protein